MRRVYAFALAVCVACGSGGGGGSEGTGGGTALPLLAVSLELGTAGLGTPIEGTIVLRNPVGGLPLTITDLRVSSTLLVIDPGAGNFPIRLQPGENYSVAIVWTPARRGFFSETLRIDTNEFDPVFVAISGTGFDSETTIDFGFVPFSNGIVTDELAFDLPADAISFTIEAVGGTRTSPTGGALFVDRLIGPSGKVYVDDASPFAGPYIFERIWPTVRLFSVAGAPWVPANHASLMVPNTDRPGAQLESGGGRYRFRISNHSGTLTGAQIRVVIESRQGGSSRSHVDLNVFIANGHSATAATAPTHAHLQSMLARAHNLLQQAGIGLGDIDYLGLGHTREAPGPSQFPWTYDIIDDTCPGTNCVGDLSQYLMDANPAPQTMTLLTPGQSHVLQRHILIDPGASTFVPRTMAFTGPLRAAARLTEFRCANRLAH